MHSMFISISTRLNSNTLFCGHVIFKSRIVSHSSPLFEDEFVQEECHKDDDRSYGHHGQPPVDGIMAFLGLAYFPIAVLDLDQLEVFRTLQAG